MKRISLTMDDCLSVGFYLRTASKRFGELEAECKVPDAPPGLPGFAPTFEQQKRDALRYAVIFETCSVPLDIGDDTRPEICQACHAKMGDDCQCDFEELRCACGGTGGIQGAPDADDLSGYGPCPECAKHFPHHVGQNGFCVWCGMSDSLAPCPSLSQPNREARMNWPKNMTVSRVLERLYDEPYYGRTWSRGVIEAIDNCETLDVGF
jgi:hypothetical protein